MDSFPNPAIKVSIIIPAYNESAYIENCLKSLAKQTFAPYEIIVVDNNSKDNTAEIARKYTTRVYSCRKQGISSARNLGAQMAEGDLVCFMDADGTVCRNWVRHLVTDSCRDAGVTGVTGLNIFYHANIIKFLFYNFYTITVYSILIIGNLLRIHFFAGNNMAVNRKIFHLVGGFPDCIGEDVWFSKKLRRIPGIKIKFDPLMIIRYSSRRFDKNGFFPTMRLWMNSVFSKIPDTFYRKDYSCTGK